MNRTAKAFGDFNTQHAEVCQQIKDGPCVLNRFLHERDAIAAAMVWSDIKDMRGGVFTVVHSPSNYQEDAPYFVVRGDGGMIRTWERMVGRYLNGRKLK